MTYQDRVESVRAAELIVHYLPQPETMVIIHCEKFSCAASVDKTGQWWGYYSGRKIESQVLGWMPLN